MFLITEDRPSVGAGEACDLLILIFNKSSIATDQKIAGFASSYGWHTGGIRADISPVRLFIRDNAAQVQ
ncbi:hypothetical protein ACYZUD_29025 [Pseudomonas sp. XS1P51]